MGKSPEKRARQLGQSVEGRRRKLGQGHPTGMSRYAQKQDRGAAHLEGLLAKQPAPTVAAVMSGHALITEDASHGWLDDHLRHSLEIDELNMVASAERLSSSGAHSIPVLTNHKNPKLLSKDSIIAPQYGRPKVTGIDYNDGAIIDHKLIQAEGALMKSQRRRLQEARLRQQTQNER